MHKNFHSFFFVLGIYSLDYPRISQAVMLKAWGAKEMSLGLLQRVKRKSELFSWISTSFQPESLAFSLPHFGDLYKHVFEKGFY